jgi:hypothetical protein
MEKFVPRGMRGYLRLNSSMTRSIAALSLCLISLPAISWGCTAPANSIFNNPCADTTYGNTLVQFESDTVQAYLATHALPAADSYVVYTYGRSDLRTEIRGLMLLRLFAIVSQAPADRGVLGTSLYNWFQNRVWQNEKTMTQSAVNDKNNFLADKCNWKPDPDIASQYGLIYEGGAFCGAQLLQLFASPTVPAESYFQAAAFKNVYGNLVAGQQNGPTILEATYSNVAVNQAYAAIPAVLTTLILGSSIEAASKLLLPDLARTALRIAEKIGVKALSGEEVISVGAGPGIVVGLMIDAGVAAGTEAYDADTILATLGDLDTLNASAHGTPPNLAALLNDPATGIFKLNTSFVSATLPEVVNTTALPLHRTSDPFFQVSVGGGASVPSSQMVYQDWANRVWTAGTWGGWLVRSSVQNGVTIDSIGASLDVLYPGTPANAQITAGRFSADRFVVTGDNSFNQTCPTNPATGESDVQGAPAIEVCSSFMVRQLLLLNGSGVLQNVTLPFQVPPAFPEGANRTLNFNTSNTTNIQSYIITATGTPTPSLSAISGVLPPGFTFMDSATLGIPGAARILAPLNITTNSISLTPFTIQATNNSGSATQAISLNYSQGPIAFHSADTLTLTRGVPTTFNVSVQGTPPLTTQAFFSPFPAGMTFIDRSTGNPTLSGVPAVSAVGCNPFAGGPCVFSTTDANGINATQFFTINVVSPATPQLIGPASADFTSGIAAAVSFRATGAQTQTHFSASIPAAISGWLSITDFGDGTAQISGTPPVGSAGVYNVTVFLGADGLAGTVQANFALTVIGSPVFTSAATYTAQTRVSSVFTISTSEPATFTLSGTPPAGTVFTSNPGGQSSSATLSLAPIDGAGGIYPLIITATNANGTTTQYFAQNVQEAPSFATVPLLKLMVGVNRQLNVLTNGFPKNPGFALSNGTISNGISVVGGGNQLPPGTILKPAAGDGSNSGAAILSGMPLPGSQGTYSAGFFASSELGFSQQIFNVTVSVAGDANGDSAVTCSDVNLLKASLNKKRGQTGYNPDADINLDGVVDIKDVAFVTSHLAPGTKCP